MKIRTFCEILFLSKLTTNIWPIKFLRLFNKNLKKNNLVD
jgi:hypothetical protein